MAAVTGGMGAAVEGAGGVAAGGVAAGGVEAGGGAAAGAWDCADAVFGAGGEFCGGTLMQPDKDRIRLTSAAGTATAAGAEFREAGDVMAVLPRNEVAALARPNYREVTPR
ncbi:hypothetical protein [Arthrobacter sp. MP_M7]|uniref:hypothetical protein n=1 Tax=Arthrobacter sp. MP_M7 TaxID=3071716 RepID=UPI002E055D9A|nr:hypothetical protein [Arthrobacter sp. MP_M7]